MAQENVDKVLTTIAAWNRGDLDSALSVVAADVEIDLSSNEGPWRGVYRGRDAARQLWQGSFIDPWKSVQAHIDEVIEADKHVVTRQTGRFVGRDGIELTARMA